MPAKLNRHARTIQFWARHFETSGALPVFLRGKHQKTESLMHDEDFMAKCAEWLHAQLPNQRSPQRFQRHLNMEVIPLLTGALEANLSESTARRWMQHIGYRYELWKKNVYTDGHEREDVTACRERFCKLFLSLAERMKFYSGEDMATVDLLTATNEPEIVWITHDESVFYANDDGNKGWPQIDNHDLHKKGRGCSIMVSDFLCPCHGRLFNMVNNVMTYTTRTLHVGKNNEGYWTCEHMIKQVQDEVISAFGDMHPGAMGLFTFDQSTNHAAFTSDALRASNMGLRPGGAQALLRPGRLPGGSPQGMVFDDNHPHRGEAKGLQQVLLERGYDIKLLKMSHTCKEANIDTSHGPIRMCCARHCMASQDEVRSYSTHFR
ncbi:hypothetical protein H257_00074 [Aphanomyces astaci]|uniref:Uncharacterized protein n=1 Tax=Aphanomyces astaci TaxID=112090 RepID=W4H8W8_APHAT|nr:hypothetical protein H257_00074 [Aphanomyces astaci]ETV88490.1 hypothetical protein H257_00074 [Aphanomyces astaci]|eukprot:XP_009820890.1 hypothetical protein H257_00074 [Aphanomyces astaci]